MWAVFIFLLGIIGVILINVFGNVTTTNQQDYTLLKNTVEAAMYDSIDMASYRVGFYLCVDGNVSENSNGNLEFVNKNQYDIVLNRNVTADSLKLTYGDNKCKFLKGEVKLNAEVFVESFMRRYSENMNNNKNYQVTVQEVIEYPPKVSVRIDTFDTYNSMGGKVEEFDEGDFNIRNQLSAILEEK